MCYFGSRDELSSKELKVIKALGLKFRGKNEWIYSRAFETGYAPDILDETQVVQLTLVFQQLYMALKYFIEGKVKVDFESGNILYRNYDDESKLWLTYEAQNIIPKRVRRTPVINDELLLVKLNKLKVSRNEIELDTLYLNFVINDKEFEKPFLGKLLIIADCKSRRGFGVVATEIRTLSKDSKETAIKIAKAQARPVLLLFISFLQIFLGTQLLQASLLLKALLQLH